MKRKTLFLAALIITSYINAQTAKQIDKTMYTCKYSYTFQQDSTDNSYKVKKEMILQIGHKTSKFSSLSEHLSDSICFQIKGLNDQERFNLLTPIMGQEPINRLCQYSIYKNYPNTGLTTLTDFISTTAYKCTQTHKINWNIIPNSDTIINKYKCSKATTFFAGRHYYAWFTMQVPISEGPYKFSGLPGLIVKIYDINNEHCFTLNTVYKTINQSIFFINDKRKDITSKEYIKIMSARTSELYNKISRDELVKFNNEEDKIAALNRVMSKNNFIERY